MTLNKMTTQWLHTEKETERLNRHEALQGFGTPKTQTCSTKIWIGLCDALKKRCTFENQKPAKKVVFWRFCYPFITQ
ncbi:hypothetical protein EZS27_008890 [termite gut metagenome]|uniref:Uncharacterized protein n=1 Tax=termite gut metagenome TaxID=433724 RepID=A0A5J4SBZ2_9ZZZZ